MPRLALLIPLLAWLLAPSALAAGNGTIDVTLGEKTPGAALQAGANATLYVVVQDQDPKEQSSTPVPASGQFTFSGLATEATNAYQVLVQYAGAPYVSDKLGFAGGQSHIQAAIGVYEPTDDDKVRSVAAPHIVLTNPDAANHELPVLELDTFVNGGQRTFVPSTTPRAGGPPNLLRFSLPPNSHDLQPGSGILPEDIIQIQQGFGALTPLTPGRHDLGFTFRSPYQSASLTFSKSILYPTKEMRVLAPAGKVKVRSPQLKSEGMRTIGSQTYEVLTGAGFTAGSRVELTFSDLPGISPLAFLTQPGALQWLAAGLAAIILGLLGWYLYDRRRNKAGTKLGLAQDDAWSDTRRQLELEQRDLLIAMARLDDRYEAGKITQEDYRLQREANKAELRELMRQLES
ncbi:MAG: hypothetical protein KGJ86_04050 [Chloroflexota bacterium]|nr:hypothetical protein [Chloroflexota bacterium]